MHRYIVMGWFRSFRKQMGKGLHPTEWMNTKELKDQGQIIKDVLESYGDLEAPASKAKSYRRPAQTFAEAMQRYGLTDAKLQQRIHQSFYLAITLGAGAVLLLCYTFYLFSSHLYLATLTTAMLTLLLCTYTLREYLVHYKLKHRILRFSWSQWLRDLQSPTRRFK